MPDPSLHEVQLRPDPKLMHCPLSACDWTCMEAVGISQSPTLEMIQTAVRLPQAPWFLGLLMLVGEDERHVREHLESHALLEWVTELTALQCELAPLRALGGDREAAGEDPQFYEPGHVYLSANGWFRFDCQIVAAGVALGVQEQVKWIGPPPTLTRHRVWRSVRVAGCDTDVTDSVGPARRWAA